MSFKIFNTESFQKGVLSSNISSGGGSGEDDSKFVYEIGSDKTYTTIQSAIEQYNIDRPVTVYEIQGLSVDRLTAIFKIYPGQYKENISIPLRYSFLKFIGVDWSRANIDNPVWFEGTVTVDPDSNPYIPDGGPSLYNGQVIFENISFIHTSVQTENTIIIPNSEGDSDLGIEIEFERCYFKNQNITLGDNNEHSYKGCYLINSKILSDGSSLNGDETKLNFSNTTLFFFTIGDNKIRNLNINDCEISETTTAIKISGVCDIKNSIIKQGSGNTFTFDKTITTVTPTLNIYNSNIMYLSNDTFIDINGTGYDGIYIININNNVITNPVDTIPVPLMILDNNSSATDDSTVTFINNTIINNDSATNYNIIETEESYPSGGNLTVFYSSNILSRGVAATITRPNGSNTITIRQGVDVTDTIV